MLNWLAVIMVIGGFLTWGIFKYKNYRQELQKRDVALAKTFSLKWSTLNWLEIICSSGTSRQLYDKIFDAKERHSAIILTPLEIKKLKHILNEYRKDGSHHSTDRFCEKALVDIQQQTEVEGELQYQRRYH